MANAHVFAASPEVTHPDRVKKLRGKILKDVARKVPDGEILKVREYAHQTSALPLLRGFPAEFRQLFIDAIVDQDMLDDLQSHDVINWCPSVKKLYPIKTTADGNCLLHAASKYVFGVDDRELFLRRLLYVNLSTDTRGRFKQRWLLNQRTSTGLQGADVRIDTEEYGVEWDSILKATEDATQTGNNGLPYCTLESVHLYVLANIFRRPVILLADRQARNVYGQSLQENHIGGIYLPLEWKPNQCHKYPIVLGYNMNHFAPLLMEDGVLAGVVQAVPMITKQLDMMAVRYLLPEEESHCTALLQNYLDLTEVQFQDLPITAIIVTHKLMAEKYDMIDVFRRDCEKRFRRMIDQEAGIESPEVRVQPLQFQVGERPRDVNNEYIVIGNNVLPNRALNIIGNRTIPAAKVPKLRDNVREDRNRCLGMGCQMYGQPELGGLCSKCFNEFTVEYNRQEDAKRNNQPWPQPRPQPPKQGPAPRKQDLAPLTPPAAGAAGGASGARPATGSGPGTRPETGSHGGARHGTGREEYHNLSMMLEDCRCGFKCSPETYPYCPECYPGPGGNQAAGTRLRQLGGQQEPADQELSIMPEKCYTKDCTFQCSKATFPYCHECYEKNPLNKQLPTAPPPSIPMEVDPFNQVTDPNLQLRIEPQTKKAENKKKIDTGLSIRPTVPPTNTNTSAARRPQVKALDVARNKGELQRKCKTEGCSNMAIRGNDGTCDDCYHVSLFGAGNNDPSPTDEVILNELRNMNKANLSQHCMTPNCQEEVSNPSTRQCLECFLRGDVQVEPEHREHQEPAMNISIPELNEEKILNSGTAEETRANNLPNPSLELSGPQLSGRVNPVSTIQGQSQEPMEHATQFVPTPTSSAHPGSGSTSGTYRKYICATAGCEGLRNDNGYCYTCTKKRGTPVPSPAVNPAPAPRPTQQEDPMHRSMLGSVVTSPTEEREEPDPLSSNLEISCSPGLTEKQRKELNPMITSSRQKVKCASPSCEEMIYPPRKLCEECSKVLDQYQAQRSLEKNKKAVNGNGVPCATPGCQFFGTPQTRNYCSSCYKSGASVRHTTAPITTTKQKQALEGTSRHTAPLTAISKRSGKQCIELNCTRYGDPLQADRCSQHYTEAMARMPPGMSQESISRFQNGPVNNNTSTSKQGQGHNVACVRPKSVPNNVPMETETSPQVDPLVAVMSKVEGSRKSSKLCANNHKNGCQNYGNSKNKGYCNTCYPEIQRQERTHGVGQNEFG